MRIGYARVSTEDQCLDLQVDALEKAGCDQIFTDHGVSAVATNRPGLTQALAEIQEDDVLVTWRFDRLARSLHDLMNITASLHLKDAGLLSLTENVDTASPSGRLILHIFGAVAEFERNLIIERTKAGLAAAKARGSHIGRPRKLSDDTIAELIIAMSKGFNPKLLAQQHGIGTSTLYRYVAEANLLAA